MKQKLMRRFFVVASEDAESQPAFKRTLAEYDEKSAAGTADSDEEGIEEDDDDQPAVADAIDKADTFATKQLVDWGMGDDDEETHSLSPALHSAAADDSDASSYHEADDHEEDEEEEEYGEEEEPRELSPTLPEPSTGSGPLATQSTQEDGGEGYRPLFPVGRAGPTSEVS